jgi:hypothetical protein
MACAEKTTAVNGGPAGFSGIPFSLDTEKKNDLVGAAYSQGGVKFPTGGIPVLIRGARERSFMIVKEVSRSGEKPEPTVTVRMREDRTVTPSQGLAPASAVLRVQTAVFICALILVTCYFSKGVLP